MVLLLLILGNSCLEMYPSELVGLPLSLSVSHSLSLSLSVCLSVGC